MTLEKKQCLAFFDKNDFKIVHKMIIFDVYEIPYIM